MLFQQTSGPATAKGVEDTALYVYVPLVSRNEVGGKPYRPLRESHQRLHERNTLRAREWPRTLLATNTHDTKRSADLRSRLDALTIVPEEWTRHLTRWRRLNKAKKKTVRGRPAPDTNTEYLYYQTLLGLWPAPRPKRRVDDLPDHHWLERARDRLVAYMHKAVRESKTRTSWTERDALYEKAVESFVRASIDAHADAPFLPDVARLTARIADPAFQFALARILLHLTSPGVPDIYQGDELWNFTLVDPDNRRAVDFDRRTRLLPESATTDVIRGTIDREQPLCEDIAKLALTTCLLRFRREHARLFLEGEYIPLFMQNSELTRAQQLFAFARLTRDEACMAIARTRVARRGKTTEKPLTRAVSIPVELVGRWRSVFTARDVELVRDERSNPVAIADVDLIGPEQPYELLLRINP
jgi:(1->4)-alpha-D-glucan 1-alpha-D-glucosylmutase